MPNPTAAFFANNSSQLPGQLKKAADAQDNKVAEHLKHAVPGPSDI